MFANVRSIVREVSAKPQGEKIEFNCFLLSLNKNNFMNVFAIIESCFQKILLCLLVCNKWKFVLVVLFHVHVVLNVIYYFAQIVLKFIHKFHQQKVIKLLVVILKFQVQQQKWNISKNSNNNKRNMSKT